MKFNISKLILGVGMSVALFSSCKKEDFDVNDQNVYTWQRNLYRQAIQKPDEIPSAQRDFTTRILIDTDTVRLNGLQVKNQQDSIWKASGRILSYEHKKIK